MVMAVQGGGDSWRQSRLPLGPPLDGSLVDAIIRAGGDSLPGVLIPTLHYCGGGTALPVCG